MLIESLEFWVPLRSGREQPDRLKDSNESQSGIAALDYWARRWNEAEDCQIAPFDLSFASRAPTTNLFDMGTSRTALAGSYRAAIREKGRDSKVTLYMYFLSTLEYALRPVTDRESVGVWANFTGRTTASTLDLVGWLAQSHLLGFQLAQLPAESLLSSKVTYFRLEALTRDSISSWQTGST